MNRIFKTKASGDGSFLRNQVKLLAAQTVKIASINGVQELEELENELEKEIQWENRSQHQTLDKIRHRGEHILHAKACLLLIVILNVIDCCLVIGALLIEFHHMQNIIEMKEGNAGTFLSHLKTKYPHDTKLTTFSTKKIYRLYEDILVADVAWNNGSHCLSDSCASDFDFTCSPAVNYTAKDMSTLFYDHYSGKGGTHYIEEKVSHILHYFSIAILALLLIETGIKIFCTVPRFFKQKLQVFDAFVVLVSFILDLIFIDGFLGLDVGEFVLAVTFILPWRIIRILNSLVVAVMEKERYTLKIIYKQKKKVEKSNAEAKDKVQQLMKQMEALEKLCETHNVPSWEVKSVVGVPEKSSALSKLALHAAGSLTPAPMTGNGSSTPNVFLSAFQNGLTDVKEHPNGELKGNGHIGSGSVSSPDITEHSHTKVPNGGTTKNSNETTKPEEPKKDDSSDTKDNKTECFPDKDGDGGGDQVSKL